MIPTIVSFKKGVIDENAQDHATSFRDLLSPCPADHSLCFAPQVVPGLIPSFELAHPFFPKHP